MNRKPLILAAVAVAFAAACIAPFLLSTFTMTIAINALVFAIFAVSLNIVLGYAGLPSLGHAAFFGVGAYTVALMVQAGLRDFALTAVSAVVVSGLAGLLLSPILLRTRGTYFLMATLAVGEVLRNLAISWRSVTNGDDGLYGIKLPAWLAGGSSFYYFLLAALVISLVMSAVIARSPFGHALRAVRDNRSRASVLGISPLASETAAFVIGAALAGFAGAMFAYAKGFVSPGVLSVETSADGLLMVVLGGPATLFGPVIGAVVVELIRGIVSTYTSRWLTILGLLACIVALNPGRYLRYLRILFPARQNDEALEAPIEQPLDQPHIAEADTARPAASARRARGSGATIEARNIAKSFGGLHVLTDISLSVAPGERRGLIGPNGAGKTTFMNILSGILPPNRGSVHFGGVDVTGSSPQERARLGLGRTFQIGNLFNDSTVRENILVGLLARDGHSFHVARSLDSFHSLQNEATALLDKWGLREWEHTPIKLLAYGQRRLVEIALAVAQRPKVILLDEPAAGLSGKETKTIIQTISMLDPELSLLIIEHDMDLVFSVCDSVTVLANGRVLAEGEGDSVRRDKNVIEAYLGMPL